jgi:hypothetical protein
MVDRHVTQSAPSPKVTYKCAVSPSDDPDLLQSALRASFAMPIMQGNCLEQNIKYGSRYFLLARAYAHHFALLLVIAYCFASLLIIFHHFAFRRIDPHSPAPVCARTWTITIFACIPAAVPGYPGARCVMVHTPHLQGRLPPYPSRFGQEAMSSFKPGGLFGYNHAR